MGQVQPPTKKDLLPYAGFALTVGAMIWQGGQMSGQVKSNTDRITQMEARGRETTAKLEEINMRSEKSSAKLDFLIERVDERDRHHAK